jgi:hypothetical protein
VLEPLVPGVADVPFVPDSVVVPGPEVVPVPAAPMPLLVLLRVPLLLVPVVPVAEPLVVPLVLPEPIVLVPEPVVPDVDVEVRLVDWQPAASAAASARLSSARVRAFDRYAMVFPR